MIEMLGHNVMTEHMFGLFVEHAQKLDLEGPIIVINTNGMVKNNGDCVMGRGNALALAKLYPSAPSKLGGKILANGNIVQTIFVVGKITFVAFPVKYNWWEKADLDLIERSKVQLLEKYGDDTLVVLMRPGCGNGGLSWDYVRVVFDGLPDNYMVCHMGKG